jgi:hypothetical protein
MTRIAATAATSALMPAVTSPWVKASWAASRKPAAAVSGVAPQDLERAGGDGAGPIGVVANGSDPLADSGVVEPEPAAAVGVEGERDVSPVGQRVHAPAMHVVDAGSLVSHQHGRQGSTSVGIRHRQMPGHHAAVRHRQMPDHHAAVRFVLDDLARRHHPTSNLRPSVTTRNQSVAYCDRCAQTDGTS